MIKCGGESLTSGWRSFNDGVEAMIPQLFTPTLQALEKNLDLRQQRQQVLSSNIANAENPDYVRRSLSVGDTTIYGVTNPLYGNYIGSGSVEVNGITRSSDQFLEAATRQTGAARVRTGRSCRKARTRHEHLD